MGIREHVAEGVNAALKRFGVRLRMERPLRDAGVLLRLKADETGARTFLDIGANEGQFAAEVLRSGWRGRIVSFEPTSQAHRLLAERAGRHEGQWVVVPRVALGSSNGEAQVNIAINSVSSSLLQVRNESVQAAPESGFNASESVPVRTLDSLMQPDWEAPFALKIDTQGFELEVLNGATETLARTSVVALEMSLAELYDGGARMVEIYAFMEKAGFRCISLVEVFSDFERNELLQVDGVFVRNAPRGAS
jgi:FkbM family methyltransferase